MVTESLVDSGVNSTCIESKDLGVDKLSESDVSAQATNGVMSSEKLVEANGSASSGSKRARVDSEDQQAAVHVRFECLSRYV